MTPSIPHCVWRISALLLALAWLSPQAQAQSCEVAEGQTLTTIGTRVCNGGSVFGLLHNLEGGSLTSERGMLVAYPGSPGTAELRTDGAYISLAPGLLSWGKVTIGSTGSFEQRGSALYSFAAFTNQGRFTNSGIATFAGGNAGSSILRNAGVLVNAGTLDFTEQDRFSLGFPWVTISHTTSEHASLINTGQIENRRGASILLDNSLGQLDFTGGELFNQGYLRVHGRTLVLGEASAGTLDLGYYGTADFGSLAIARSYTQENAGRLNIANQLLIDGSLTNRGALKLTGQAEVGRFSPGDLPRLSNFGDLNIGSYDNTTLLTATLTSDGAVSNQGRMVIEAGSNFTASGFGFANFATLISRGQIDNIGSLYFNNFGSFTLDGPMTNTAGNVKFWAGSVTAGNGRYYQSAFNSSTQLDGIVAIAAFEIAGGRLCGSGFLNGNLLMSGGTLCPGNSPGTLHIGGDLEFRGGSLRLEVAGTAEGQYDVLQVDGALSFASGVLLEVAFINGFLPRPGDQWSMLRAPGGASGLAGLAVQYSGLPDGYMLALSNSGAFTVQPVPIPEPGTWLLMLAGLGLLAGLARRRKLGLAALGMAGALTLPVQASCLEANRVVAIPSDFSNPRIAAGVLKVNLDPLGCLDTLPLIIDAGGRLDNHAGLGNQLGSFRGPNNLGGLFVNGLLDNKAGANIDNLGEFYVDFRFAAGVGRVINDGVFINQGLFDMWGTFTTGSQGSFIHQGGSWRSGGLFSSAGSFENKGSVSIVGGSFTNSGLLTNRGSIAVSEVTPSFANAGVIDNLAGASLVIDAPFGAHDFTGGTLNNAGLFSNRSGLSLGDPLAGMAGGTVQMLAGSLIEGTPITVFEGHTQVNAGRLRMNERLTVWGGLQNDGVLDIHTEDAAIGYPGGFASLVNNKTLNIGGNVGTTFFQGRLSNGATLVNNDRMLIERSGGVVNGLLDVNVGQIHGHFDNNGELRNEGSLRNFGVMSNNADFLNDSLFISSGELINQGAIINRGTARISGTFAMEGPFENSGTVLFEAGSLTQGNGSYIQLAGLTQLDGEVDVRLFELRGGNLCGSGFLKGNLVVEAGTLCPGNSPGHLRIGGDLEVFSGTLRLEIAGPGAGEYDTLQIDGRAIFFSQARVEIVLLDGYLPQVGAQWSLLSFANMATGLSGLAVQVIGSPGGLVFVIDEDGSLTANLAPVPEPKSWAVLLAGLIFIGLRCVKGKHCRNAT